MSDPEAPGNIANALRAVLDLRLNLSGAETVAINRAIDYLDKQARENAGSDG